MQDLQAGTADRILWQGTPVSGADRLDALKELAPVVLGAAVSCWIILNVAGLDLARTPAAWVVVLFFALPVAFRAVQAGRQRPATGQRYTLTERQLIVESSRGRHAYGLRNLGELTLTTTGRDGVGSIALRRPEPSTPKPGAKFVELLTRMRLLPPPISLALIDRIREPERVLQLISEVKRALIESPPTGAGLESATPVLTPTGDIRGVSKRLDALVEGIPWAFGAILLAVGAVALALSMAGEGFHAFGILPLAFAAFGGWIVVRAASRARLERRLRTAGVTTRGTITQLVDTNVAVNDARMWVATYRYRTADGREQTGRTRPAPFSEVSRWAEGDEIDVRYDAARPERSVALEEA